MRVPTQCRLEPSLLVGCDSRRSLSIRSLLLDAIERRAEARDEGLCLGLSALGLGRIVLDHLCLRRMQLFDDARQPDRPIQLELC